MILRLTDGTNTTSLVGTTVQRVEYVPRSPEFSAVEFAPETVLDGGEVTAVTRRNITEQCMVTIVADTMALVQAALAEIEALFMKAIEYQNKRGGSRVWVELATDDVTVYRSEILYGRVELGAHPLRYLSKGPALAATLIWRRRYYWEAAEVAVTVTNTHGSGTTGVTVYNYLDAMHHNYVDIASTQITGQMPTPARIEFKSTFLNDVMGNLFIGHNVYADPNTLVPILECEGARTAVGGVYTDATCSDSTWMQYLLVNLTATRTALMTWQISSTNLSYFRGRFFRLFLRCQAKPSAGVYVQAKVLLQVGAEQVAAAGQETLLNENEQLQDLGVLQIPPYLMGDTGILFGVDLALYGRARGAGTLGADFLYLMPLDGYRELRPRVLANMYNITLIDDGMTDNLWAEGYGTLSNERMGTYYGMGPRIMLVPGRQQRLHFLQSSTVGGSEIARTGEVVVKYRPRRVTL
jgi:hypothetical protein